MNPQLEASLAAFDELFEALARFVAPLDDACLQWQPPIADANTIAALVHHTAGSTNLWMARAVGETIDRDRDAEFRGRGSAADLIAIVERCRSDTRRRIGRLDGRDLSGTIEVRRAGGAHAGQTMRVSLAWCVEHALVHAGEHWGHIQLTQQLFAARG